MLEADPDLGHFLTSEEREAAASVRLPLRTVRKGGIDLASLTAGRSRFGALIVDGMLLHSLQVGDQLALQLMGPGDLLSLGTWSRSMLISEPTFDATTRTRLALLGEELLLAARRWPQLITGFNARMSEQSERLATQLAICQLPRVDQRLLSVMWLLAESWGQVTPSGTTLPLMLTHDLLGGLIGARRPTVTLALGALADRGAIVRQDRGWLLLEPPPRPSQPVPQPEPPDLLPTRQSRWASPAAEGGEAQADLPSELHRLRADYAANVKRVRERLDQFARVREDCRRARQEIVSQALSRRLAPSSRSRR